MVLFVEEIPVTFGPHWADERMLWITGIGVGVTALVAVLTLWANFKAGQAQKTATEAMQKAVSNNAKAAERQAAALTRLVESVNAKRVSGAPDGVQWELEKGPGKTRWALKNVGTATADNAVVLPVTAEDLADFNALATKPIDVPPGGKLPFGVERSMASRSVTFVSAVWNDASGVEQSATFIVP